MHFTVIIPLKDRPVAACVESLLAVGDRIHQILICDGGSTRVDVVQTLRNLSPQPQVKVLTLQMAGFNKAQLINRGLLTTQGEWVLVSDADIVWNREALEALGNCLRQTPLGMCHVEQVTETNPNAIALQRQRYSYRVEPQGEVIHLAVFAVRAQSGSKRPGCGLVCAHQETFRRLGGYKECFAGWGWEDQDLLIRARLLGIPIQSAGQVLHQSHGDCDRNQFCEQLDPQQTRDRNLLICLSTLQHGELWGNWGPEKAVLNPLLNLQIYLPESLQQLASELNLSMRSR